MQRWLSFHFYPLETLDVFLARGVRPFLEHSVWPVKGARAFFVRYDDEKGPHIRLRIRGEADWLHDTLRPALEGWMADRGERTAAPYAPEAERFGGTEALVWAEEHFHLSTRVTLDRLNRDYTYGDALFDALRLNTILAYAAGMDRIRSRQYFRNLADLWVPMFFKPEKDMPEKSVLTEIIGHFEKQLTPQRKILTETLAALWEALQQEKFDASQPEWLRWLRGNQVILPEFGENMEKVLPDLIHLTHNRIGLLSPDEAYVCYILGEVL